MKTKIKLFFSLLFVVLLLLGYLFLDQLMKYYDPAPDGKQIVAITSFTPREDIREARFIVRDRENRVLADTTSRKEELILILPAGGHLLRVEAVGESGHYDSVPLNFLAGDRAVVIIRHQPKLSLTSMPDYRTTLHALVIDMPKNWFMILLGLAGVLIMYFIWVVLPFMILFGLLAIPWSLIQDLRYKSGIRRQFTGTWYRFFMGMAWLFALYWFGAIDWILGISGPTGTWLTFLYVGLYPLYPLAELGFDKAERKRQRQLRFKQDLQETKEEANEVWVFKTTWSDGSTTTREHRSPFAPYFWLMVKYLVEPVFVPFQTYRALRRNYIDKIADGYYRSMKEFGSEMREMETGQAKFGDAGSATDDDTEAESDAADASMEDDAGEESDEQTDPSEQKEMDQLMTYLAEAAEKYDEEEGYDDEDDEDDVDDADGEEDADDDEEEGDDADDETEEGDVDEDDDQVADMEEEEEIDVASEDEVSEGGFQPGETVYARFSGDGFFYMADINRISGNAAEVTFFDNYTEVVGLEDLREPLYCLGKMKAQANWEERGNYYPCVIQKIDDSRTHVHVYYPEDGAREMVTFSQLRFS